MLARGFPSAVIAESCDGLTLGAEHTVAYVGALDATADYIAVLDGAAKVVQMVAALASADARKAPKLWLVTRATQPLKTSLGGAGGGALLPLPRQPVHAGSA